jgi:hypothetical protein
MKSKVALLKPILMNNYFKLISKDKNFYKFNNFCFVGLNTMKQQMCTLPLSSSTKSKQGADGFRGF